MQYGILTAWFRTKYLIASVLQVLELEDVLDDFGIPGRKARFLTWLTHRFAALPMVELAAPTWLSRNLWNLQEEILSELRLEFRVTTGAPTYHQRDDDLVMHILYGLEREHPLRQEHGLIATAGCGLAWPNVYQHRKILAIFLVDPSIKPTPSATNIPPSTWNLETLEAGLGSEESQLTVLSSTTGARILNL
ncbi:hypothetical protein K438DRAFT_1960270 [Mycena galopus ATCC 62051]|nr:hypothetical protein K438DRAFT_1960270 [Mycena galopus ATCC 62051]